MTNTISVPRELLLELRGSANDCYNNEVRRYKDDRRRIIYKALVDKADELLAAPSVEVEGLDAKAIERLMFCKVSAQVPPAHIRELASGLPKAQAIIDQQASRIAELEREICYLMGQINGRET